MKIEPERIAPHTPRNSSIDFLKLLCAFLVVLFHCAPAYSEWTQAISNCAVPCFFMISGYLLFSDKFETRSLRSINKTMKILLWSTLFYLPLYLYGIIAKGESVLPPGQLLVNFFLFNENPVHFHLWYLSAYIYVLAIVVFLNKHNWLNLLFYVSPLLWVADILCGMGGAKTIYVRNFLFEGLPCFAVGMLVRRFELEKFFSKIVLIILILFLCVGCIIESHFYESTHQLFSTSLLAFPLLLIFLSFKEERFKRLLHIIKSNDSLYIYIFHPAVMFVIAQINKFLPNIWTDVVYNYISPVLVFVTTSLLVIGIRLLRTNVTSRFLKVN